MYLHATEIVFEFSKARLGTCGSLPASEKTENLGFMKKEGGKKHIWRLKKKTSRTQKRGNPCPLSSSGHLGFQVYLGPCVWAPRSCKIMLLFLCNPNSKHTNPFSRRALDRSLTFPETDVPAPLTCLSNYLKEQQGRLRQHPHAYILFFSFSHPLTPAHVELSWDGNILKHIYT